MSDIEGEFGCGDYTDRYDHPSNYNIKDLKITITLTEDQLVIVQSALEVYTRIHVGQLDLLPVLIDFHQSFNHENVRHAIDNLKVELFPNLPLNASYGILQADISDNAKISWEIYQTLRHAHAWKHNPAGGFGRSYDKATKISNNKDPLPTIIFTRV